MSTQITPPVDPAVLASIESDATKVVDDAVNTGLKKVLPFIVGAALHIGTLVDAAVVMHLSASDVASLGSIVTVASAYFVHKTTS